MKKVGFLFDLDGVLIDSEREYTRIWNEIERCYPTGIDNFALSIKGQTLHKILNDNYLEEETRRKVSDMLHRLEGEMRYSYCKGAEDFLSALVTSEFSRAVVTSSDALKMEHLYRDLPLFKEKIDVIIDASKVSRSKPDPEGYLLAASALDVAPANCAVFEDSVEGVKAGKASGAYVVGIAGTKTREDLEPFSDKVIDGFHEITVNELYEILKDR